MGLLRPQIKIPERSRPTHFDKFLLFRMFRVPDDPRSKRSGVHRPTLLWNLTASRV